jgi:hypothetical protein
MNKQETNHIGETNKMVTAVDTIIKYCEEKLHSSVNSHGGAYASIINFCKQQAKAMEKEQIIDARLSLDKSDNIWDSAISFEEAEKYYTETYWSNK